MNPIKFFHVFSFCVLIYVHAADVCDVGTVLEECVLTSGDDVDLTYFCTDRYIWEWSDAVSALEFSRSDSIAISIPNTILDQSTIVLIGGCAQDEQAVIDFCETLTPNVDMYVPETDEWRATEPLPIERIRFGAINIDKHIFVFGGRDVADDLVCQTDVFNVIDETWTTLVDSEWTDCLSDLAIFTENGAIYLVGGYDQMYATYATTIMVEIEYDATGEPSALTYTEMTPMNQVRGDHSCWSNEGQAYCMGGFDTEYSLLDPLASVEMYDVESDVWTAMTNMTTGRGDFVLGYLNDRLTAVGGETFSIETGYNVGLTDIEWYDIENDCWSSSADVFELPYPRFRFAGAVDTNLTRLYVFGGQSEPVADTWPILNTVYWYQESPSDTSSGGMLKPSLIAAFITALYSLYAHF